MSNFVTASDTAAEARKRALLLSGLLVMAAFAALWPPGYAAGAETEGDPTAPLESASGYLDQDTDPTSGALGAWTAGRVAVDYLRRSVGVDLSGVTVVRTLEMVNRTSTSRLTADDYTLWASDDNEAYEELTGWSLQERIVDGRLTHSFSEFEVEARYLKVNTRYDDTAWTFAFDNAQQDLRAYGEARDEEDDPDGPGLTVVERGEAFAEDGVSGFRPAITEAPNGDILVAFNTTGDVDPGGEVRLIRSTDRGRTWSDSEVLKTSEAWGPEGSIYSSRGMTTLSDGTILLPFNDGVNHSPFNNRDSELFVASSTDSGRTWTGLDEPVELPVSTREHWACCSRILELDDGSLLMPLWGSLELVDDWERDPMRWRAAVVKSYDGGETWEDYSTIAYDPHNPPGHRGDGSRGSGVNEPSIVQLASGRLVAMVRYSQHIGPAAQDFNMYLSHSDDRGATWSAPVATDPSLSAQTPSLFEAPSTAALPEGDSKLLLGYRTMPRTAPDGDLAAVSVSFDEGVTWEGRTLLEEPSGLPSGAFRAAETDFLELEGGRLLTLFQFQPGMIGEYKLGYNMLEDRSAEETVADAEASKIRAAEEPAIFLERQDRDAWPFGLALRQLSFPSSRLVAEVAAEAAEATSCHSDRVQLIRRGQPDRPLDPAKTLEEAGARNGDTLIVRSLEPRSPAKSVGITHWDAFPEARHLYAWSDACDTSHALDAENRSLGLRARIPGGQVLESVSLRNTDDSTRLTEDDYRLWVSADNDSFTEVDGWDLHEKVDQDGRLIHTFTGLSLEDPYLKISQPYDDANATFIIDSSRSDITVHFGPKK